MAHIKAADLLIAQSAARTGARGAPSLHPRVRESLPRQLRECMQELLSVNERYHDTMQSNVQLEAKVDELTSNMHMLSEDLAFSRSRVSQLEDECKRLQQEVLVLQSAQQLQSERHALATAETDTMNRDLQYRCQQVVALEKDLAALRESEEKANEHAAQQYRTGYEQATREQQLQASHMLRRLAERAEKSAREAFELGKGQRTAELSALLQREQAHRRLLLHRAEEARQQQMLLEGQLALEKGAREQAQGKQAVLEERLKGVRGAKQALGNQLAAARSAHAYDLGHFQEMEEALQVACYQFVSLASARNAPSSPARQLPARSAEGRMVSAVGHSPPEAIRNQVPRPVGRDG
mmetsp:Transcript_36051/g.75838  ORF Transcript_36051/g.75838 Transcript_36051/m.75838 type:complete len:352 (-) Transcript_36051:286-1341(-)